MKRLRITYKGEIFDIDVEELPLEGGTAPVEVQKAAPAPAPTPLGKELQVESPMSGRIVKLFVDVGSQVEMDDPIAILEAMKMESRILADRSGVIRQLFVKTGQLVDTDEVIAVIG